MGDIVESADAGLPIYTNDAGQVYLLDAGSNSVSDAGSLVEVFRQVLEAKLIGALPGAPAGVSGMTLIVRDAFDNEVFKYTAGDFSSSRRVPVASASKLVSGLVLLRLVEKGVLSMNSTPRGILGWSETQAADATLDHLGAFVSGLPPSRLCNYNASTTLQDCVATFQNKMSTAPPGQRFDYGASHLVVAAAMAEQVTSSSWAEIFIDFKNELGISNTELRYVTLPKQRNGGDNPLVAGGLLATADEYLTVLALLFHRGQQGGTQWIATEKVLRFSENLYANAMVGESPLEQIPQDFRYSWTSWLNCEGPVASCPVVSSAGAFGFTPWVDFENEYYAVLAMESNQSGGAFFSLPLVEQLRPDIERLVAAQ